MTSLNEARPYRSILSLSNLWWGLCVFGLFGLLTFVLLQFISLPFALFLLLGLVTAICASSRSAASAIGIVALVLGTVFIGVPAASILWTRHMVLAEYDQPAVRLAEPLELSGNVYILAPKRSGSRYVVEADGTPTRDTKHLLLVGQIETITIAIDNPNRRIALPYQIPRLLDYAITFGIADTAQCREMLAAYRARTDANASRNQYALADFRELGEQLGEECIEQQAAPNQAFDYSIRYGLWRSLGDPLRDNDGVPINEFGFWGGPSWRTSPPKPYRAGVRIAYAEIVRRDGSIVFKRFTPRAHALAMPLYVGNGRGSQLSLSYAQTSSNSGVSDEQLRLLPEVLGSEFRSAFHFR